MELTDLEYKKAFARKYLEDVRSLARSLRDTARVEVDDAYQAGEEQRMYIGLASAAQAGKLLERIDKLLKELEPYEWDPA